MIKFHIQESSSFLKSVMKKYMKKSGYEKVVDFISVLKRRMIYPTIKIRNLQCYHQRENAVLL